MAGKLIKKQLTSVGFHYYEDTEHYTKPDLENLLSAITDFKQSWVVLQSETSRSIPEYFLRGLHSNGVQTIVQLKAHASSIKQDKDIPLLLHQYGEWGVKCVQLAGFPNMKSYWGKAWLKTNIVEEFAVGFFEFSKIAISEGILPVMSTLIPGGDFWDTVFLHTIMKKMIDENETQIIQSLALTAGGWTFDQSLDYGLGGHEVWSDVRPYHVPEGCQSQSGLHTYEWYLEIAREVLGRNLPVFLVHLGETFPNEFSIGVDDIGQFSAGVESVADYLTDEEGALAYGEWVPAGIFSGIPKLDVDETTEGEDDKKPPLLSKMAALASDLKNRKIGNLPKVTRAKTPKETQITEKIISHYLLLPVYEWGIADWHLEVIKPFIQNHRPTVGFSLDEAKFSKKVTIVGDETIFSSEIEQALKDFGCSVERISGDGPEVASQMTVR